LPVTVVTDSAASLPEAEVDRLGIVVVPMTLVVGGIVYEDGQISPSELLERAATETVSTASPTPGDFMKALESVGGDGALVLTVSSHMSATYEVAHTAAGYLEEGLVKVLDSGTAAGAQGLVALAAAEKALLGASVDEVAQAADDVASKVHLVAALDNLDYLARSGRVPGAAAWAGRSLGVRALFEFRRGVVRPRMPVIARGDVQGRVFDKLLEAVAAEGSGSDDLLHVAVLHADAAGSAEDLGKRLATAVRPASMFVAPFSSVMIAHTGPGLIGVAWWRE